MTSDTTTEARILEAARKIFHQKGLGSARMAEIAKEAGINKAMLHYYFRSKQKLFERVLQDAFAQVLPAITQILASELPLKEKIEKVVAFYVDTLIDNPQIPVFVLNAIQEDAEGFAQFAFKNNPLQPIQLMESLMGQISDEAAEGRIQPIDPRHLLVNLIALSVFPFMMQAVLKGVLGMSDEDFKGFVQQRKKIIPEFIMAGLQRPAE